MHTTQARSFVNMGQNMDHVYTCTNTSGLASQTDKDTLIHLSNS